MSTKFGKNIKSYSVYYTTASSKVVKILTLTTTNQAVEDDDPSSAASMVSYQGIITNALESNSGIYMVDKKVKLVLSHLCLVSNIQILRKGQRVQIRNAHYEQIGGKRKVLWACGRTEIRVLDELKTFNKCNGVKSRIYNKEEVKVLKCNPVLNMCHKWNLTVYEVLCISDIYQNQYLVKFRGILSDQSLESDDLFSSVLKLSGIERANLSRYRCFISEYLSAPHNCDLWFSNEKKLDLMNPDVYSNNWLRSIKDIKIFISKEIEAKKEKVQINYSKNSLQYNYCVVSCDKFNLQNSLFAEHSNTKGSRATTVHNCNTYVIGILNVDSETG